MKSPLSDSTSVRDFIIIYDNYLNKRVSIWITMNAQQEESFSLFIITVVSI